MRKYSHNKLHRVETTNVLPSKSFHVHGVFFKYRDNYYVDKGTNLHTNIKYVCM